MGDAVLEEMVVQVSEPEQTKGWFGLGKRRKAAVPKLPEGNRLFLNVSLRDGGRELREIERAEREIELDAERACRFVAVRSSEQALELPFAGIARDTQGHDYDLLLRGVWRAASPKLFLETCGLSLASPQLPLSNDRAVSWMLQKVGTRVRDAVRGQDAAELVRKEALPAAWWEVRLNEWLSDCGIQVSIREARWSSAEAEHKAVEEKRLAEAKQAQAALERRQALEREKRDAETRHKTELERIEHDATLSAQERVHQLEVTRKRHLKELVEADAAIESARRDAERAALEHEAALARLRNDIEAASSAKERQAQADQRHQELVSQMKAMQAVLDDRSRQVDSLLAALSSPDRKAAFQAAERLVSPEFGFRPEWLRDAGFLVSLQGFVQYLREKAVSDGEPVFILKRELVTRDIGKARVKGLPVNTSLQFEFSTKRSGYVALLNIGTSGSVYVHVPNPYVTRERAKVEAGRSYAVPGPELLPWERLREQGFDYVEIGPPGWEHVAVLVSDVPLVSERVLASTRPDDPFVRLRTEDVAELCETLSSAPAGAWSAGVMSFLVG